jgi:TonB family protein
LAAQSVFEHRDERRMGPAAVASLVFHVGLWLLAVLALSYRPPADSEPPPPVEYDIVFVHTPGPGGGGGGSPAPAPPEELSIPEPEITEPEPIPIQPDVTFEQPPELPTLTAPVYTNNASVIQASGDNQISFGSLGGGGEGGGIGEGTGDGLGPGTGGGFGGGAFRPGSGVSDPTLLRQESPRYTSEAMRAKIQGLVELEAVVLPNGTVGDVRIVKSLDARFGLDQEAIRAAKRWLFRPGQLDGEPVPVLVTLILEFRLH